MTDSRREPVCHVCGSALDELWATATDTEYGTTAERFGYYLCRDCEAISIDPMPSDRLDVIYPPTYYSFASGGEKAAGKGVVSRVKEGLDARSYRRALKLLDTDTPDILDVGGGAGDISAGFIKRGGSATVVDLDAPSIEIARQRGLNGFVGRIEDFETEERFDLALMLNLIEHVPDPVAVLSHVRGLMRPSGLIWLQTPNFRALDARVFRHRNWAGYHCPRHFAIFSEVGLRRALARAGLEPVRFDRTQGGGFWSQSLIGLPRARRMAAAPAGPTIEQGGVAAADLPKPIIRFRAFAPLAAAGTAFDMATRPVRQVSQVMVLARPSSARGAVLRPAP